MTLAPELAAYLAAVLCGIAPGHTTTNTMRGAYGQHPVDARGWFGALLGLASTVAFPAAVVWGFVLLP